MELDSPSQPGDGTEYRFRDCIIGSVSPGESARSPQPEQSNRFITPAIDKSVCCVFYPVSDVPNCSSRPSTHYDYYPKYQLVSDGPVPSGDAPLLLVESEEEYTEFYSVGQRLYKIRHKQRRCELLSPDDASIIETSIAGRYREYWRYVENHPALHSAAIQDLILDLHHEAVQLIRHSSGKQV